MFIKLKEISILKIIKNIFKNKGFLTVLFLMAFCFEIISCDTVHTKSEQAGISFFDAYRSFYIGLLFIICSISLVVLLYLLFNAVAARKSDDSELRKTLLLNYIKSLNILSDKSYVYAFAYNIALDEILEINDDILRKDTNTFNYMIAGIHPDDKDMFFREYHSLINGVKTEARITIRLYNKKKGKYQYYEVEGHVYKYDKNKRVSDLFCMTRLKDECQYQSQLKSNADLLRAMNNHMPVGMFFYDHDGCLKNINESLVLFLGLDKKKILSSDVNIFTLDYIPEEVIRSIREGKQAQYELKYETVSKSLSSYIVSDSECEIFDVRCAPVKNDYDDIIGYITIYNDITKLNQDKRKIKELQNDTELALDAGDMSAWRYDCQTESFNMIYGRILNRSSLTKKEYEQLVHEEDKNAIWNAIDKIKNREADKITIKFRINSSYGCKWFLCSLTAVPTNHEIRFITGTARDITDEVEAKMILEKNNRELEKAKLKAEESERLKMAFLANMSHEIRTPLNAIVGFSEMVQFVEKDDERKEYMNLINTNNELLLRIIDDILNLSKIESGALEIKYEVFNIIGVLDDTFMSFLSGCDNPDINFKNENKYEEIMVCLDRERFVQIISNFISNAIKYTSKGEISIGVIKKKKSIKIYVRDTGIGIDEEQKHLIFKRFEKLNSFAQGTGLGLAICKAIAKAMNGKVGFDSRKGEGSEFWVSFPINDISFSEDFETEEVKMTLEEK